MLRASFIAVAAWPTLLAACNDMFSVTPMEEIASFELQAGLHETDALLEAQARSRELKVGRDPNPREQAIPRDYLGDGIRWPLPSGGREFWSENCGPDEGNAGGRRWVIVQ